MVMCDDPLVVLGYGRGHAVFRDPREREVVAAVVVSAGLLMLGVVQQLPGKHGFHLYSEGPLSLGIQTLVSEAQQHLETWRGPTVEGIALQLCEVVLCVQ